jgi:predicted metalloprotease with PDZ domain
VIRHSALLGAAALLAVAAVDRGAATQYRFTFPEPRHRWMQVEATFADLPSRAIELRMSRSSPGRYSIHDFAKNVYDVHAFAADGHELGLGRPDSAGWIVENPTSRVRVTYKVYGDLVDGTYLAVDETHAHINMPAAVLWARGLDDRPAVLTFVPPDGVTWTAATQLHAGSTPFEFTAPNLQYLMDSPVELGPLAVRQFTVGSKVFRFAAHHNGTDAELDDFVRDVRRIVEQEGAVFGEFPAYEPGCYTFLADYLRYATGDAMEHRNSTVMTSTGAIRTDRIDLLDTVAHEFFHSWNVERIRPRSLEPFDFDHTNIAGELWLAEGFTQYYGPLMLQRAGIVDLRATAETMTEVLDGVTLGAGRAVNGPIDMSRMAVFTDGGTTVDRTNWRNTYISYYPYGAAVALALDLTLRERSSGRVSLDDYMRALWTDYGRPGGAREGYVDHPYTIADAEARLADVGGDRGFARDFFLRYIEGRELADYRRLLAQAGLSLGPRYPGRGWLGDLRLESRGGRLVIADLVAANSPAYAAGLEQDDEIRQVDGVSVQLPDDALNIADRHRPGDQLQVVYADRTGVEHMTTLVLAPNPHLVVVPLDGATGGLTAAQRMFRDRWLGAR